MATLDLRVIKVAIEVDGQFKVYSDLLITATGTKYANPLQNECEIKITNLDQATIDYIVTETSPLNLNRTPKTVRLEAGRISYGVSQIFIGNIVNAIVTQPPDVEVRLKCLTGNFSKGNVVAKSQTGLASLSSISQGVADDLGLTLNFQATDKQISNYTFSGGALKQVNKINDSGPVNAYVDDGVLVVKDANLPLPKIVTIVNANTGMIGVPELTEQGVRVKFLLDGQTTLGGLMRITSVRNPGANGDYIIYKLGFQISTREEPFYWIADGKRVT